MVRINPPTDLKRVQFLGSPFRGKKAKEKSSSKFLTEETPDWSAVIIEGEGAGAWKVPPQPQEEEWEVLVRMPQEMDSRKDSPSTQPKVGWIKSLAKWLMGKNESS